MSKLQFGTDGEVSVDIKGRDSLDGTTAPIGDPLQDIRAAVCT